MSKKAILFPGQGAQQVGMGRDLAEARPESREVFDRASEVLGYDLAKLCFDGPQETLTKSDHAQPAIFVSSVACYDALMKDKPSAAFAAAAGLSSGEWTALYASGVVSFEDTVRVLQARGQFMQTSCETNPGAMLSVIGLDRPALDEICEKAGVQAANFNSPQQTVLSGTAEDIGKAEELAKAAGAKRAIRLNVSGAFHSVLMEPAAREFGAFLAEIPFSPPTLPVVSNVTGVPHTEPEEIRQRMVDQITSSVQWVNSIEWMRAQGVETCVECGPGNVLTGLVKRIDKQMALHNIQDRSSLEATLAGWTD